MSLCRLMSVLTTTRNTRAASDASAPRESLYGRKRDLSHQSGDSTLAQATPKRL